MKVFDYVLKFRAFGLDSPPVDKMLAWNNTGCKGFKKFLDECVGRDVATLEHLFGRQKEVWTVLKALEAFFEELDIVRLGFDPHELAI